MTAAVITAALFFVISPYLKKHGKGLTSMPRQYKQIHFVLGKSYIYIYIYTPQSRRPENVMGEYKGGKGMTYDEAQGEIAAYEDRAELYLVEGKTNRF